MKFLMTFFLSCIFLANLSFSVEFDKIDTIMKTNIDTTLQILQKLPKATQNTENIQQAANQIFALFDSIFDYTLMSQLALSQHYKTLTPEQLKMFNASFEQNLKKSFTDKLKLYKDEKMEVIGGDKPKNNRYNLKTSLILDGKVNYITFKFYENNKDWKIYDVDVLGVSIIQTYRSQINDILTKSNFNALLDSLKNEIALEAR